MRYLTALPIFPLIVGLFTYACRSGGVEPEQAGFERPPAGFVVLERNKPITTADGLTVVADSLFISICPPNFSCLVPDNLSASIRISRADERTSVRLFTWFGGGTRRETSPSDSASVRLGGQLYKVILRGQYSTVVKDQRPISGRALLQVARL